LGESFRKPVRTGGGEERPDRIIDAEFLNTPRTSRARGAKGHDMLGTLLTFFAVGLITLLAVGLVLSILGFVFALAWGIATFVLFKVAPIVLVGWLVLKLYERWRPRSRLPAAERPEWIESGK